MKGSFIILILITTSFITIGQNQLGLPLIRNFTPEMYQGGIQNWEIVQDRRGVIHVANNFGLLQYDGNDWRNYPVFGATKLRSIATGSKGYIYAGLQGDFGYYAPDSLGVFRYHSLKHQIPAEHRDIGETWKTYIVNNLVYFCTFRNIYVYNGDSIHVITRNKPLDVSYQCNNSIYTQLPGEGLFSLENDKITPLPYGGIFRDKIISGLICAEPGRMLISTARDGIYITEKNTARQWNEALNSIFKKTFINCMRLLKNGNIAIGTQHKGVYIIDPHGSILLHLDKDKGLHNRTVLSLYEDFNNNLWVGQNNGISFIQLKSPFRLINEELELQGTGYAAYMIDNSLYLGTNNGAFMYKNGEMSMVDGSDGQVYSFNEIGNHLLMGHNDGAYFIKEDVAKRFQRETGTWTYEEFGGNILMGTYKGIWILNQELQEIAKLPNLEESSRLIERTTDSTIWMAHGYKGLYRISVDSTFSKATHDFYNVNTGLPSNFFNSVTQIEGNLKVITSDGIYDYNSLSNKFLKDSTLSKYFTGEHIFAIKSDIYNNIYFITNRSVGFLEKTNGRGYKKHVKAFNSIRRLLNDDLPNINLIGPNLVLFGAKEGFVLFDRNLLWTIENEDFSTLIRKVSTYGKKQTLLNGGEFYHPRNSGNEIEYKNNSIQFEFASLAFSTTEPVEFQYKLEGFDSQWSDWNITNFKEYTNLKEGEYNFMVRSKNASGQVSKAATYGFIIHPPWYRSYFSYSLYTVLLVLVITGLVITMNKKHTREKELLEQKRIKELTEKDQQLHTITKHSKSEIDKLKNEKLESEIRHMQQELATNTMHLLNKNEFINKIKSTLEGVEKKSINDQVKAQIRKVIKNIGQNIKTDGDWENFQMHFDKVHGNFSMRIKQEYPKLTPQEIKLSAYLRLNLTTKEIANLLNISVRGVEIARYRLRKKLSLKHEQNLTEFIMDY